jgi:myo-inositol 2-dehydrogenase/D-chiro-inositol 1-dehydrogenase
MVKDFLFPFVALRAVNRYGYDTRLEVYGDKAMLTLENLHPSAVTVHTEQGEMRDPIYKHFSTRFVDAYYSELDHFIAYLQV